MYMVHRSELARYAAGIGLMGGTVTGTTANLLGYETVSPAYFGAAFAAGVATVPEAERSVCRVRRKLPV